MYKCKACGAEFVGDGFTKGLKMRCPNCRAVCEELLPSSPFVCKDCGLVCDSNAKKCPACGGEVIKDSSNADKSTEEKSASVTLTTDSAKKELAQILGGYTYVVLIGIWSCIIYPCILIARDGILEYRPYIIYPMLGMSVLAAFMLFLYYTDNIKFLKWMFPYCLVCGGILMFLSVAGGNASGGGGAVVWFLLACLFRKYRKL